MLRFFNSLRGTPSRLKPHHVLNTPVEPPFPEGLETAVFASGCFWGSEKAFWRLPGVYSTAVGYTAGSTSDPTYSDVCTGRTGHAEAVQVVFDPKKISYGDLLYLFWTSHDPTQGDRQGNDTGSQYRSGIYWHGSEQISLAEQSRTMYSAALGGAQITTEIAPAVTFHYAEQEHQQYLARPFARQYCSAQPRGVPFSDWLPQCKLPAAFWAQHGPRPGCTINVPNAQLEWN
eukprot:NODE_4345_length_803_cov_36.741124_g4187_i0.p1 GENE.NODE_4345_length_803_cov_36.741124_g4187_i0~~NODE_4345_length_803_cov_36.741124_g4187_i0.p1  ORF type:complete len:244 (+),score=62.96 NODE_4345_length_803_cov_36.741124_g4187_i0:42-734(+)